MPITAVHAVMIACEQCCYFKPDGINPEAGIGRCIASPSHGAFFPAEKHLCHDFLRNEQRHTPALTSPRSPTPCSTGLRTTAIDSLSKPVQPP